MSNTLAVALELVDCRSQIPKDHKVVLSVKYRLCDDYYDIVWAVLHGCELGSNDETFSFHQSSLPHVLSNSG